MPDVPLASLTVMDAVAPLCSRRVLASVTLWLGGAMLAPGQRPGTAVRRVLGQSADAHVQHSHRVLNRAPWAAFAASRRQLGLRLGVFGPEGPGGMGLDATSERRRGERRSAQGSSRAPVRSSQAPVGKASGVRGVCLLVLARLPWGERGGALPCRTVLAPAARCYQAQGRRPPAWRERARPMGRWVRRWWPRRELGGVGDRTYAAREGREAVRQRVGVSTRWRLDAALSTPAPPRTPKQHGRPRKQGRRRLTLAPWGAAPPTPWQLGTVAPWSGQQARRVPLPSATAGWEHAGLPPVPMRWGLSRAPTGTLAPQA